MAQPISESQIQKVPTMPVLGGRGGWTGNSPSRGVQVYGAISTDVEGNALLPSVALTTILEGPMQPCPCDCPGQTSVNAERCYRISTSVIEAQRETGVPVAPATYDQIVNRTLPGATFSRRGTLQLQIGLGGHAGGPIFQMDGGQTIDVWASKVTVSTFAPANFLELTADNPITVNLSGTVIDNFTTVAIVPIEDIERRNVLLTQRMLVPQATQPAFEVPPFARRLQLFQDSLGTAAVFWRGTYGGALAGPFVQLDFITGRRISDILYVGDYTHIVPDLDAASARNFIAVWEIQP